ncbi:hypothetical protein WA158_005173 [Blastocystis sp. Blastoise]
MKKETLYATLVNIFGGCIYGFNTGIVAGLTSPLVQYTIPHEEWSQTTTDVYIGLFNAIILIFATFGSPLSVWIANKKGIKMSLIITALIGIICPLLLIVYLNYWYMVIIRGLLGLAIGFSTAICPMYTSTIVPEESKGKVTTLFQLSICGSICLAQIFNFFFTSSDEDSHLPLTFLQYGMQLGISSVFGIALLITMIFAPNAHPDARKVASSLSLIVKPIDKEKSNVLFAPHNFKWLFFSFMLAVMNQLTGINGVVFYAPRILKDAGVENALLIQILLVGGWNTVTVFIFMALVDKLSRKTILNVSLGLMAIGSILMVLSNAINGLVVCAFVGIVFFILGFEVGPGPLFFVMASQDFPKPLFDQGLSIANVFVWILNTLLSFTFPIITGALGATYTFTILGAIQLLCILYFDLSMKNGHMSTGESTAKLITAEP